ncbi:hypothetical protein C8C83_0672 [Flavobacterium sp. 90]|uniref:hypothetical protein n=1 Tax=unclassified Flavobacterium TaxID=196869 RepID=UPI000F1FD797|nr:MULTISPECIES: hypothetical protein [unclassified Flavobacterium]RKR09072.1 hypothetical protein C8C82_0970 [Flavobacterium sp. 81]TCK52856.1 hypothetical protein C8C83_0672 [Flavobacterium sp. 90]
MKYTTSYTNSLNFFWILLFGFSSPFIIFPEVNQIYLSIYFILILLIAYSFSIHFIYQIEIIDTKIIKSYFLKKEKEIINFEQIKSVSISIPSFRDPPAIGIIYLDSLNKEKKNWFICFDKSDLKKLYKFFIDHGLNVEVVPKEKLNDLL